MPLIIKLKPGPYETGEYHSEMYKRAIKMQPDTNPQSFLRDYEEELGVWVLGGLENIIESVEWVDE